MSATGRSGVRRANDFYETPSWCVDRLLDVIGDDLGSCLEPAAGSGNIIRAVNAHRAAHDYTMGTFSWTAVDNNPEHIHGLASTGADVFIEDFLNARLPFDFDTIIGNPPFSLAEDFVRRSLSLNDGNTTVIMLLRLNFAGTEERQSLMQLFPPDIYVLPNRPSFTGKGTDACEYAWFVWPPARKRANGLFRVLPLTPLAERRVCRVSTQLSAPA